MDWRVAPITLWPGLATAHQRPHPFRRTVDHGHYTSNEAGVDWTATTSLLEKELGYLDASNVILQMFVEPGHIRVDGWIKQNARPYEPGIILSFDSKHGHLSYPCDTFTSWHGNIRAVAKGLEDLRRLDRYGITSHGEQYTGWLQITAASGGQTPQAVLAGLTGFSEDGVLKAPKMAFRAAAKAHHPDFGGDAETMKQITEAARSLGAL